jgi:hypothetical protein
LLVLGAVEAVLLKELVEGVGFSGLFRNTWDEGVEEGLDRG